MPAPRRLLVADNNLAIGTIIARIIIPMGLTPTLAATGAEAIAAAHLYAPELCGAILDIQMPGMNGVDAALAFQQVCPDRPIVLMSGSRAVPLMRYVGQLTLAGFLAKPFTVNELRQMIVQLGLATLTPDDDQQMSRLPHSPC
jgi:CheY-like chemotaxis protein